MISFNKCFINLCISIYNTTKKRDCTIAVPRFEALVLPFVPNNNTEAHAVCIYMYAYAYLNYTYHRAPCAALFWNSEFTRFRIAKTKRVRRLFQYVRIPSCANNIFLSVGKYGKTFVLRCKGTKNK